MLDSVSQRVTGVGIELSQTKVWTAKNTGEKILQFFMSYTKTWFDIREERKIFCSFSFSVFYLKFVKNFALVSNLKMSSKTDASPKAIYGRMGWDGWEIPFV